MDTWPVELLSYVFELACTDDGRTARTLSLTSKPIREISRAYLYQSLVLTRLEQLGTLLEKFQNLPFHLRQIKHLFLALNHSQHSEDSCPEAAPVVIRVLHLAAPTLQSLSFVAACPLTGTSLLSSLFRIPFPHLDELSLAGLYPYSFQKGNFPSLHRLHFASGNRNPCGLFTCGALDRAFPQLTHLRVSGLSRAMTFSDELEHALNQRRCRRVQSSSSSSSSSSSLSLDGENENDLLPPHLERIYIQTKMPTSPAISRSSSRRSSSVIDPATKDTIRPTINNVLTADTRQQAMMERLMRLEEEFGTGRYTPVCLTVVDDCEGDVVSGLLHDWLDRLGGGDGAWA